MSDAKANQRAKDAARAAYMKKHGIMRRGSDYTLKAIEGRERNAIPAGKAPSQGWFESEGHKKQKELEKDNK